MTHLVGPAFVVLGTVVLTLYTISIFSMWPYARPVVPLGWIFLAILVPPLFPLLLFYVLLFYARPLYPVTAVVVTDVPPPPPRVVAQERRPWTRRGM